MKNLILSIGLVCIGVSFAAPARAFDGHGNLGFIPYGLYQPYGIRYSTSVRTPPYFATNPPVYYGSRYARPYGISPFASPPLVSAPASYQARPAAEFVRPITPILGPPICNPYVSDLGATEQLPAPPAMVTEPHDNEERAQAISIVGAIQFNPFVNVNEIASERSATRVAR